MRNNLEWVERSEPHRKNFRLGWVLWATLLAIGCGGSDDPFQQPKRQVTPGAFGVNSGESTPPPSGTAALPPPPPPSPAPGPATAAPAEAPSANAVKAEAGVGKKGRGYGAGMITTPVAAYFSIQERLAFDQVAHAMDLYKATNDHAPKSHEEFMEKIIKENGIKLPQLPAGERYLYDPKTEQLMVERPAPE